MMYFPHYVRGAVIRVFKIYVLCLHAKRLVFLQIFSTKVVV